MTPWFPAAETSFKFNFKFTQLASSSMHDCFGVTSCHEGMGPFQLQFQECNISAPSSEFIPMKSWELQQP